MFHARYFCPALLRFGLLGIIQEGKLLCAQMCFNSTGEINSVLRQYFKISRILNDIFPAHPEPKCAYFNHSRCRNFTPLQSAGDRVRWQSFIYLFIFFCCSAFFLSFTTVAFFFSPSLQCLMAAVLPNQHDRTLHSGRWRAANYKECYLMHFKALIFSLLLYRNPATNYGN